MLEVKFIKNLRDDESKKILKEEATWCFLALAGLLILLYMGANVIIDTYFYMISLNILIFLFSYIILRIKKKMHYYSYVVGCAFFAVWLIFYSICDLKSRSLKGYLTKQLPVLYYIPTSSGGRGTSSGFRIECKGSKKKSQHLKNQIACIRFTGTRSSIIS